MGPRFSEAEAVTGVQGLGFLVLGPLFHRREASPVVPLSGSDRRLASFLDHDAVAAAPFAHSSQPQLSSR
jgi:hypothetical protein